MNFLKRGFVSVLRKPGKSLILLVLIFVLGNVMAGAISVKAAIANTQAAMNEKIGVICRIGLDQQQLINTNGKNKEGGESLKIESLTAATVNAIGQSKYVKYYDYFTNLWLMSDNLENYVDENASSSPGKRVTVNDESTVATFSFSGGQNPAISDIVQGKATLYQGRVFTADEIAGDSKVVLVSKNLAEKNALSVGSTIKFKREIYKYLSASGEKENQPTIYKTLEFEFTVIGIFIPEKITLVDGNGQLQVVPSELENTIYAANVTINKCNTLIDETDRQANNTTISSNFTSIDPMFVIKDPNDLEAFTNEATPKLPKYYMITDNSDQFKSVSAPMTNMGWIAGVVLYVAIGATILILSLLITLFLRDRRHEMGIYLSLGERKIKIVTQILIEVMMIAFIAVSLSLFTGNIIAKNISSQMLQNQITAEQQNSGGSGNFKDLPVDKINPGMMYNSRDSITSQDLIDSYKVVLDGRTVMLFYLIGLGTVLLSTLVPIAYTLRLNPKKILM